MPAFHGSPKSGAPPPLCSTVFLQCYLLVLPISPGLAVGNAIVVMHSRHLYSSLEAALFI
jgi:hypothetical protein